MTSLLNAHFLAADNTEKFELDLIKANVLRKFNEDEVENVASIVLTSTRDFQDNVHRCMAEWYIQGHMDEQLKEVCDLLKWSSVQLDSCRASVEHPNKELERVVKLRERQILQLKQDLREANEEIVSLKTEHEETVKDKDEYISELREQVLQLETELDIIRKTESEPNKADDHLTIPKDNAQIREVSDAFNELYDTHHSLAFEEIEKNMNEEEIANILLKTLYDVMQYTEEARKEKRFRFRNPTLDSAFEKYISQLLRSKDGCIAMHYHSIKSYFRKCFEICWQICCYKGQFQFHRGAKKGDTFSADIYKTFTKTGKIIDYIVWPPLLYVDSDSISVVCKGVAQCQK